MTATIDQQTVGGWGAQLDRLHARLKRHFGRAESRRRVRRYVEGLLGPTERKHGWQLAEQAGEATPYGMQRLLAGAKWDADAVRDDLRAYVVEHLADPDAVLIVDETGCLKQGVKSVGVQRQYSGTAGRIEHCQSGVFLADATPQGRTFLDRELYLPQGWADDPARRDEAGVPVGTTFQTKPELAQAMLARALDAGVPAAWVAGDAAYGHNRALRGWLEARGHPYVLAVPANEALVAAGPHGPQAATAAALAAAVPPGRWQCLSAGEGSKGPRVYAWVRVPLACPDTPDRGDWLLVRRSLADPTDLAYYVACGPAATPLATLARVAGRRWAVEERLAIAKGEVGLDQYEVRRWRGTRVRVGYRHITLARFAQAFLTVVRAQTDEPTAQKGGARPGSPPP